MDYREFLRDKIREEKLKRGFLSYRFIGRKIQVDPSYLGKVLQKANHLNEMSLFKLADLLHLDNREKEYFKNLYFFTKAQNEQEIKEFFKRMQQIKGVAIHTLKTDQFDFYMNWQPSAIRALLDLIDFKKNFSQLGNLLNPKISTKEAKQHFELLKRLKLIFLDEENNWRPSQKHISSGEHQNKAIVQYHLMMIAKAQASLTQIPHTQREITALTVAIDEECYHDINEIIAECRRNIQIRIDEVKKADRVTQINFQHFPLSQILSKSLILSGEGKNEE
jgi:uncharacterized protein (TIGR02147 family)